MPLGVVSSDGIMQEMTRKPADQAANDAKEIKIAYRESTQSPS
jgi:hypothetical protein